MAEATVIDELIVRLTLDAEEYDRVDRTVNKSADRTERKAKERARAGEKRDKDQQKRLKDVAAGVRSFALQVAGAVGVVSGLGVAVGATLTNLLGFETGLRRQTVGTALSNRQMQAWGATARRLGADATAGAEAIATLAKERQQFELTGSAPTMQALARMGVNVDKGRPLEDVLAQAQTIYRSAPEGQKQQYENTLAAQGVSSDLILMIKSETDVREAFARSFAQSSNENRKALDALADSLESMKAQAIAVASTLLTALQPAIETGAAKLAEFATQVAAFANDLQEAGGGVEAFQAALDKHAPWLGHLFEGFRAEAELISAGGEILRATFTALGKTIDTVLGWLNTVRAPWGSKGLVDDIRDRTRAAAGATPGLSIGQAVALKVDDFGRNLLGEARQMNLPALKTATPSNPNPNNLPRNIENDVGAPAGAPARAPVGAGATPDAVMSHLITDYGLNTQEAAAVVANWQRESGLNPAAFNPAGGGTGARGLAQWRGDRTKAFQARYGVMPDKATLGQQVEFAMTDPRERALLDKSLRAGGSAAQMGRAVSQYYEAHGNVAEDVRRGRDAERLAANYGAAGSGGQAGAPTFNIQNLSVQATDVGSFVGGMERLSGSQNYNTVQR